MKKDLYVFPAIFEYADDGISIEFPDLPGCLPCAETTEKAIENAREALSLHLWSMEKDNDEIPQPIPINKISIEQNQVIVLVEAWMPRIREAMENKFVKKTLSIPFWLNQMAEHNGINFSHILQMALREKLGIKQR